MASRRHSRPSVCDNNIMGAWTFLLVKWRASNSFIMWLEKVDLGFTNRRSLWCRNFRGITVALQFTTSLSLLKFSKFMHQTITAGRRVVFWPWPNSTPCSLSCLSWLHYYFYIPLCSTSTCFSPQASAFLLLLPPPLHTCTSHFPHMHTPRTHTYINTHKWKAYTIYTQS